ncbi:hypothetical protein ACIPY1_18945 [Paenarthrobacter nicotinovorans]|uniref:hypothetical protein n=1 Tax=Paenarthrobacter nicotinovorans TaxID=29320 RepID=UPI003816786D
MTNHNDKLLVMAFLHGENVENLVELAPKLLDQESGLDRFDVFAGTGRPASFTMPEEMELRSEDTPERPYDGAIALGGNPETVQEVLGKLRTDLDTVHAYRVEEKVIFDRTVEGFGSGSPITFLLNMKWFPDAPESVIRRSWRVHEPLAAKVHVGSDRYVQWWVNESLDEGAPVVNAVVEMRYPTEKALVDGFFDSPRGADEIVQDSAHFVAGGHPRVFVTDHRNAK